jgi:phosphoserine phosphatase RsbX
VETVATPLVEYGIAKFVVPGEKESGDQHLVCCSKSSLLIAAIDGLGHGEEAANAAKAATVVLRQEVNSPIISTVERCHEKLRATRGVVMSLAAVDLVHGMMTWLGVGNVQGVLMRAGSKAGTVKEVLLLRGGVVGGQLPALQAAVLPVFSGDTLVFVTDGVRSEFLESLTPLESPQRAAERILKKHQSGTDDALVLVARFAGIRS